MENRRPLKIGIFGGGQLARMLCLKGHELGFEMHVLSEKPSDPAAQVVHYHHLGRADHPLTIKNFLEAVDVATFESEFLDAELLKDSEGDQRKIFPSPRLMGLLQDRLSQKDLLVEHNLPTLPHLPVSSLEEARKAWPLCPVGLVLKKRRFGYDGYGTYVIRKESQLEDTFASWGTDVPELIAEPLCRFQRELAVSLCRGRDGSVVVFPLVESKQVDSRCKWVKGPIHHKGGTELIKKLKSFVKKIDYVGTIAFELFDSKGKLIINEIAPRVHNSAHYSLNALTLDQFSAHLVALSQQKISTPQLLTRGFAMVNLLGHSTQTPSWKQPQNAFLHWYGKLDNRPGRKMGHLNVVSTSADQALRIALKEERNFKL